MNRSLLKISAVMIRNDDKINPTILRRYFSFFQGAKTANSALFNPDSYREATPKKCKRTSKMVGFILSSFLSSLILFACGEKKQEAPNPANIPVPVNLYGVHAERPVYY